MSKVISTCYFLLFVIGSCLLPASVVAQTVNIYVEEIQAELNGTVEVNVRVNNFSDVAGAQFSLNWDADELTYLGLTNLALDATEESSFNRNNVETGKLGYIIADMSLAGFNLDDGSILFSVRFDVNLPDDTAAEIVFSDDPTSMVVADNTGTAVAADFTGAMVIVGNPNATREVWADDHRFTAFPNPFQDQTILTYQAASAGLATLSIFDASGQRVIQRNIETLVGDNQLAITAKELPATGVYTLRLMTEDGNFSRKIVFNGRRQ